MGVRAGGAEQQEDLFLAQASLDSLTTLAWESLQDLEVHERLQS